MIHLSCVGCWLLITILPSGVLLVRLLRAIIRQVTLFTTAKTLVGCARGTSLHESVVALPIVVSANHSTAVEVGCNSAASSSCAEGTDHDSTDWVIPGTSTRSLTEGWCADEYYSQKPIPKAASSWPQSP